MTVRAGALALTTLTLLSCAEAPDEASHTQDVINAPLPGDLDFVLHAKTTVTIGPFTQVVGDIGSTGAAGSVLFDVSAVQNFNDRTLASKITVRTAAQAGRLFGNDLRVEGFVAQQTIGLDPTALPAVPDGTAAIAGTTNITVNANQLRQLCPGQYGAISLGNNAVLNLNGGVYQISRLSLAAGARLEPSEPVVVLVTGSLTTTGNATITPAAQSINPLSAADIRIEVAGNVTLADGSVVTAHLLVPNGKMSLGKNATLTGAAWAKSIAIGAQSRVFRDGSLAAVAAAVPPPCNDNSACTVDACVGGGTAVAFCRNTPVAVGTACGDDNLCNGIEACNAAGQCQSDGNAGAGTSCPDGDLCNGDEVCNGGGTCTPNAPPEVDDNNTCTADACDATTGVAHIPLPDGTTCNGVGVCTAGACSIDTPTSGSFSYIGFDTNSATQNTANFDIFMVAGQTLQIGTCGLEGASGTGDTLLRLVDVAANLEVAGNDDSCGGVLTFFAFTAATTGTFQVRAGCFANGACTGTMAFVLTGP